MADLAPTPERTEPVSVAEPTIAELRRRVLRREAQALPLPPARPLPQPWAACLAAG